VLAGQVFPCIPLQIHQGIKRTVSTTVARAKKHQTALEFGAQRQIETFNQT
jgi:hypothetical protein